MFGAEAPGLIFTDTDLSDGTWSDILRLADMRDVPVIVVSRFVDLPLYLEVLESGAADYIVPPFRDADVLYVLEGALLSRSGMFPRVSRMTAGTGSEVSQNAQNHTCSGVGAAHA